MGEGISDGLQSGDELFFKSCAIFEGMEWVQGQNECFKNGPVVFSLHAGKCLQRNLEACTVEIAVHVLTHLSLIGPFSERSIVFDNLTI